MKTAISVPKEIFESAERHARRTKTTRSRLYTEAVREYLQRHSPDEITEAMNRSLAECGETKDEFVSAVSRRILEHSEW